METVLQFEAIAYEKNLSVSDEIQDNIHMTGNEMLLRQLIMVLLDNAVKYEEKGGSIKVTLIKRKDKIILIVHNARTFMDPEAIKHVFDRFYRADQIKINRESFGLGLSIAKSITEQHMGRISVESSPKCGTTFQVTF